VPASRIKHPLGDLGPPRNRENELHLPVPVRALPGVPLGLGGGTALGQALGNYLAEARTRPRLTLSPDRRALRLLRLVLPLRQHRPLEPAYPLDRDSRYVGDLIGGLSGADPVLDLLGSQRTLHFDLVLSEPGELASRYRPQPVIDGQRKATAPSWHCQDGVTTVLAYRDEAQLLHGRPFRAARPRRGEARTFP
jgi:hypothetical protein